jgi:hypothetical protein
LLFATYLIEYASALVKSIVSDNATLQKRVEELELDNSGWKAAFKSADDERKLLVKKVSTLERSIGSLKARPFTYTCTMMLNSFFRTTIHYYCALSMVMAIFSLRNLSNRERQVAARPPCF